MKGDGSVYVRNHVWWADYTVRGRRQRVPTGIECKNPNKRDGERAAKNYLDQRRAEAKAGTISIEADTVTLADLVSTLFEDRRDDDTVEKDRRRWENHIQPFFGSIKVVELSTDLLRAYVTKRLTTTSGKDKDGSGEKVPANATVNRELAVISAALQLGRKEGKVRVIPYIPRLDESANVRKGFLSDESYDKLADQTAKVGLWMRAIFEVAYQFGWRSEEVLNLKVERIRLVERSIRLERGETKNDDGREVQMPAVLYELIKQCCHGKQPNDYIFTRGDGGRVLDFRKSWRACCKAAGVAGLLFHDLRRTAVRGMIRSGIPERVAMEITGHKTRSVFDRYHIVSGSDLKEAAKKLDARAKQRAADLAQMRHKSTETEAAQFREGVNIQ